MRPRRRLLAAAAIVVALAAGAGLYAITRAPQPGTAAVTAAADGTLWLRLDRNVEALAAGRSK